MVEVDGVEEDEDDGVGQHEDGRDDGRANCHGFNFFRWAIPDLFSVYFRLFKYLHRKIF